MYSFEEIEREDPEIAKAIRNEINRQQTHLELIASENWVSKSCMVLALLMPVLAENQTDSLVRTEGVIGNDIHASVLPLYFLNSAIVTPVSPSPYSPRR